MESKHESNPLRQLRNQIHNSETIRIVLGAGDVNYGNRWIATNVEELDATSEQDWAFLFQHQKADCIFAEHVWEHLSEEQADQANANVFKYLKEGGIFRLAVPDGLHPDPAYINYVKPGGTGAGALDHKVLYDFVTMSRSLIKAGFVVELREYWDGDKNFNQNPWQEDMGRVQRSLLHDERNVNGQPIYTSLIVDAVKPYAYAGNTYLHKPEIA